MHRLFESVCRRFSLFSRSHARPATASLEDDALARVLPDLLDRAVSVGSSVHIERLLRLAICLAPDHPELADRVARARLADGDAESALSILDASGRQTARSTLLRAVCFISAGRSIEAMSTLSRWCRRPAAPPEVRQLMAILEREAGHPDDSVELLRKTIKRQEDPWTLLTLLAFRLQTGDQTDIGALARRTLVASSGPDAELIRAALRSLGERYLGDVDISSTPAAADVLAGELARHPQVIPALTRVREQHDDVDRTRLLIAAVERALPTLRRQDVAMESIARLYSCLGDLSTALFWARRGRDENPMSAALARLVIALSEAEPRRPESGRTDGQETAA